VRNILSIDLEDWHQLVCRHVSGELPAPNVDSVRRQADVVLELASQYDAKATFFVLGMVAEHCHDLIRRIHELGHEIASHGYRHLLVKRQTREDFRKDVIRSKNLLEDVTGASIIGYRAAEFSIDESSLWALDELAELGFRYDSSIFPIHHKRYGIPHFSPQPQQLKLCDGHVLTEFPIATLSAGPWRVPVAGGGYFRLMPLSLIEQLPKWLNREGIPMTTYFHPYEFDSERLDVTSVLKPTRWTQAISAWRWNFHQNLRRRSMTAKLACLLRQSKFTSFRSYLDDCGVTKSTELLSTAS